MHLNEIAKRAHKTSKDHGFWSHEHLGTIPAKQYHVPSADPADGPREIMNPSIAAEKIALMHTELSEAVEALRDGNMDGDHGVCEELADVIIRVSDFAGRYGFDMDAAVRAKLKKNEGRPYGHGRKVHM